MQNNSADETLLAAAVDFILRDYICVQPGEQLVLTADMATDRRVVRAIMHAARVHRVVPTLLKMQRLPFQGKLADPYIPEPVAIAVKNCDVWIDLTFPYMSGSTAHAEAMATNRVRSLNILDLGANGVGRLFGCADFDHLFVVQEGIDGVIKDGTGKECRLTSPNGTDLTFTLRAPTMKKRRRIQTPGINAPPGSAMIFPEPESVRGTVVIEAAMHEFYTILKSPIRIEVKGQIANVTGGGTDLPIMERALLRAGSGEYGRIIHLSYGFHPAARFTGQSFNEDIRVKGMAAVGFGIPWWEPGGGENHPDGVVPSQSLWIDGRQIIRDGSIIDPPELAKAARDLQPTIN